MSPVLGGIADYTGLRKRFLFIFTALSVLSISALTGLSSGMALEGFVLIVMANIGMEGGLVFYNSYLNRISPPGYTGRVSSWGYGVGYAGSVLSLLIVLPLVNSGLYSLSWLSVALLFTLFSIPAFLFLPSDVQGAGILGSSLKGIRYTLGTLRLIFSESNTRRFLLAYFLYADGVNTVIVFSGLFAARTLGFGPTELVALYITVQVSALAGAFSMAGATDSWGPKKVVVLSLLMWSSVCVASSLVTAKDGFWAIAVTAGLALGTVQAASRSLYAGMVPEGRESEYFGVYALAGKSSAIIGPLIFGYLSAALGSQRPAVLAIGGFFIGGLMLLSGVRAGRT
ncbi:MFS transporter [Nitrospirota bacterium]